MFGDLQNSRLIVTKGLLFLLAGMMAAGLLFADLPTFRTAALLVLSIWCFCRFYYFAFYVIEHYVDSSYKFAGLWSFAVYLTRRKDDSVSERHRMSGD
ncbi:MAG: hypothetical protein KDA91_08325 [Planctomycetaceae bacterium]|nr:hypothetical protein [Planctomycetaceae bacterium]